jgi:type IV secretion system effector X-Tfes-like protein
VVQVDRALGREPDGSSERLAAALAAAGARMPAISHVVLSRDGTRASAVDTPNIASEWQQRVHVEVADALQRPVEASTREWQVASQQLEHQREQHRMQEQASPALRGPVMA